MALDPSIPLSGIRPQFPMPADGLALQDLQMKVQDHQRKIQADQAMRQAMNEPDMFDDTGGPTMKAVQKAWSIDPPTGVHFLTAHNMAQEQRAKTERAKMVAEAKRASEQAKQAAAEEKRQQGMTKTQLEREKLFKSTTTDIDQAGLAAYDTYKGADDERLKRYKQARLDAFDDKASRGVLAAAGMSQEKIEATRRAIADQDNPEETRERIKTAKQREQQQKADLNNPIAMTRLDQGQQKINLAEIGQQTRLAQADRKLDQGDTKLGLTSQDIELKDRHKQAYEKLRAAEDAVKAENAQTSAEEKERHHRELEEARKAEQGIRKERGGSVSMKAQGAKMEKAPSGYEWDPDDPGALRPIRGGPKDQGKVTMNAKGERVLSGGTVKMSAQEAKLLKEKESEIATLNRELEQGKITQEQHDARISKINAQGKGSGDGKGDISFGTEADKAMMKKGFMPKPDGSGGYIYMPGGPADPAVIAEQSAAKRTGTTKDASHTAGAQAEGTTPAYGMHGQQFLDTLKPEYADLVKAVAENRLKLDMVGKGIPAKRREQFFEDVLQYKGDFKQQSGNAAITKGHMSPATAQWIAQQIWAGDRQAAVGWARSPEMHAQIVDAIREEGKKQGKSAKDLAATMAEYEGIRSGQRALGTRSANLGVAANELDEFAKNAKEASAKVPRTGFVPMNKLMRMGREQWSEDQAAFEAANRAVINAFGQVAARTGAATVHNVEEAEKMLNTAQTQKQYEAVLRMLQVEAASAMKATNKTRGQISESVTGKESRPAGPGGTSPSGAAPARSGPTRETPDSKIAPYSDAEKEKRYQEWKKQHGQ